jgi:hypothetical protein
MRSSLSHTAHEGCLESFRRPLRPLRVGNEPTGYDHGVEHMESPAKAERKQARERQFLPPFWPIVVAVAVIVGITLLVAH